MKKEWRIIINKGALSLAVGAMVLSVAACGVNNNKDDYKDFEDGYSSSSGNVQTLHEEVEDGNTVSEENKDVIIESDTNKELEETTEYDKDITEKELEETTEHDKDIAEKETEETTEYDKDITKKVISKGIYQDGSSVFEWNEVWLARKDITGIEIVGFDSDEKNVVIPNQINGKDVISITEDAFRENKVIESVKFPNKLVEIDEYAFSKCENLKSIVLPGSLEYISMGVFQDCVKLDDVVIPSGVKRICESSFSGCTSLKKISISDSVEDIIYGAFDNTALFQKDDDCIIYAGNYIIGFEGNMPNNYTLKIKDGIIGVADNAFGDQKNLSKIEMGKNVKYINRRAFKNCSNLESVDFSNALLKIGYNAFVECTNLKSIDIPKSTNNISEGAFYGCKKLRDITLLAQDCLICSDTFMETAWYNNQADGPIYLGLTYIGYKNDDNMPKNYKLVIKEKTRGIGALASYSDVNLTQIELPNGVVTINEGAFSWCDNLNTVIIPDSVKYIGLGAFYNCGSLKEVTIQESVEFIGEDSLGWDYDEDEDEKVKIPGFIIRGKSGSFAESYAKDNGFKFVAE